MILVEHLLRIIFKRVAGDTELDNCLRLVSAI